MKRVRGEIAEYLLKPLNKRVLLIVIVTVIASELFIVTDIGPFRFSIGTVVFIYAILSLNHILIIPTAVMVALATLLIRVGLDYFFLLPREYFNFMVAHQYSGVIYFLLLAVLLKPGGIKGGARAISVFLIIYLAVAVCLANLAEALVRVPYSEVFIFSNMIILLLMSFIQVFLVISLVNINLFQNMLVMDEQQRVTYEKMLIITSELYDELFYMQKSMENMENIMAKSYNLHKQLKALKLADSSAEYAALEIAEEVHEVKKDTVRILAGLGEALKIKKDRLVMNLSELLDLVIKANRSYSQSLGKKVQYSLKIEEDPEVTQIYPLLAILNNLVSNAVEAIAGEGYIHLKVRCRNNLLRISVCDNGEPVKERDKGLIFEPGYTTKFSAEGVPSTGIGLAYVRGLVENFRGRVFFRNQEHEKCFVIIIPLASVAEVEI
jgi:two-component system sensor histidine kinase YcbA